MTDKIRIESGAKRIQINDEDLFIEFNPSDIVFVEKFYQIIGEFETKLADYESRAQAIDTTTEMGENGLPLNLGDRLAFVREVCEFTHERIDFLFGAGTASKAFGGVLNLEMIEQFFVGITPFVKQVRESKTAKYVPVKGRSGRKVMK